MAPAAEQESPAAARGGAKPLTVEEAEAELAACRSREQDLELELEMLYGRAVHLCQSESRNLAYCSEQHRQVPAAIKKLQETLSQTSTIADELSGRVRKLDTICGRVAESLKLVDDLQDLRECSEHVMKAITSEDYEQAAKYVARFRAVEGALPSGTDDASVRVLREAEEQLSEKIRKRFEAAMAAKDQASVSRFAKLFHPLGLAGEGVEKYIQFLRRSLAEQCQTEFRALAPAFGKRADAGPTPYAEALTKVFVAIADVVQEHQQSVEQEFGEENFIRVIRGLLDESDTQGLKVLEKFMADHAKIFDHPESSDVRETGAMLEETALITQRVQQFDAYIRGVAKGVVELCANSGILDELPEGFSRVDALPVLTRLVQRVQELVGSYVMVEQSFLLQSVEKAARETDTLDPSDPEQLTSTLVDDAFYILQQSMLRSITTCDANAACAVVNHVAGAVSGELKDALLHNLSESKRLYQNWVAYPRSVLPPEAGEHPLQELFHDGDGKFRNPVTSACSWPHSLNNLQQCVEYIDKLKSSTEEAFDDYFPADGPDKDKRVMFQHCLGNLDAAKQELEALHTQHCKAGLQMLKVHLSPTLTPLDSLSYELDERAYNDAQVNDPFTKAFIEAAEVIHRHLRSLLNPMSVEDLMQHMAEQTCRRIEKAVFTKKFTLFGALQFDSDVRALCSFFTNLSQQALRQKFTKLLEMSNLLNLEGAAELREFYSEMKTKLEPDEIRKLLALRVDFDLAQADLEMLMLG